MEAVSEGKKLADVARSVAAIKYLQAGKPFFNQQGQKFCDSQRVGQYRNPTRSSYQFQDFLW